MGGPGAGIRQGGTDSRTRGTETLAPAAIGASALVRRLADADPAATAFYARPPGAEGRARAAAEAAEHAAHRDAVARVLTEQNRAWGQDDADTQARIERLRQPGSVAVVTGQQLGLFAGPLYTVYKALSAVRYAARLGAETGRDAVAVFWLADEDHDYDEVRAATFTQGDRVRSVAYDAGLGAHRPPVGRLVLDGARLADTLAALDAALPEGPFRASVLDAVHDAYRPGRTLRDAFARLLGRLAPGLVLVSVDDARLKRLAAPLVARELAEWEATHEALVARSDALVGAGFHAQVAPTPVNVFWIDEAGARRPLDPAAGGFAVRGDRPEPTSVWLDRLAASPERFSPNVVLRPLVQDTLFPTAAYVAGPGEMAYYAQLTPVYARFGVPMPVVEPRLSLSLVEPGVAKVLDRYGLGVPDVRPPLDGLWARLAREVSGVDLDAAFADVRAQADAMASGVAPVVTDLDASMSRSVAAFRAAVARAAARLHEQTVRAQKRRHADVRDRLVRAQTALWPGGTLQERTLSPLQIAARHGFDALPEILDALPLTGGRHHIVWV